jgi:hypothetical protein
MCQRKYLLKGEDKDLNFIAGVCLRDAWKVISSRMKVNNVTSGRLVDCTLVETIFDKTTTGTHSNFGALKIRLTLRRQL